MIPFLTYPIALLGLIGIPAFFAIYFFRNRFRRHPVSSHLLWESLMRAREGGTRLRRMQIPLIFLLELLTILLLLAAALDPRWISRNTKGALTVILDDSASMLADTSEGTPRDLAQAALLKELKRGGFRSVRLILAGAEPQLLGSTAVGGGGEVNALLREWQCTAPKAAIKRSIAAALEVAGAASPVLVVTDHRPDEEWRQGRIKWMAFGRSVPNVAFINGTRTSGPELDRCSLQIANYSMESVSVPLVINTGKDKLTKKETLSLGGGQVQRLVFEVASDVADVHARLPADNLLADNQIHLLRQPKRRVRVAFQLHNERMSEFIKRSVESTDMVSSIKQRPQIVFSDQEGQPCTREKWIVRVVKRRRSKPYVGPFVVDRSHPLVDGLTFSGIAWGARSSLVLPGRAVVMAGNVPLVTVEDKLGGGHVVHIQIDPAMSTIQDTPVWPALIWNILNWRADRSHGLNAVNLRLGMHVVLTTRPDSSRVIVLSPDGRETEYPVSDSRVVLLPSQPGVYLIRDRSSEYSFAANFIAPSESDLEDRTTGKWGDWINTRSLRSEFVSTAWIFLLLALLSLCVHMAVVSRGGRIE